MIMKPTPSERKRYLKPPAFTLIELLVALSIVGILTAILIPTTIKVRGSIRATQCISNLRSVYGVLMIDVLDHKNTLPLAWSDVTKTGWISETFYELREEGQASILSCPAQLAKIDKTEGSAYTFSMNLVPTRAPMNPYHPNRPPLNSFPEPARMAIIADGCPLSTTNYNIGFAYNANRLPELIHGDRANILFLDGHVATLKESDIPAYGQVSTVKAGTPEGLFWMGR